MSTRQALGKVTITPKGAYDGSTTYYRLDTVTYNGSSYMAKEVTTGNLPTNTAYWELLAQKGDQGIQGEKGATGNPGGAPLVASDTSEMSDTTKIYVNTTDGKWYYYDGDSWEIGGTYQAAVDSETDFHLKNGVEDLNKNFTITVGKNLFDKDRVRDGYINQYDQIVINQQNSWSYSDYIPVTGGSKVACSRKYDSSSRTLTPPYFFGEYDGNWNMIKYTGSPGSRVTLDANTKFIRFCVEKTYEDVQLEYGDSMSSYEPYTKSYVIKESSLPVEPKIWSDIKWTCIGDSLTEVNSKTTKHYFDYISENTGITIQNLAVSGSGYAKKQDTNQAFFQTIQNTALDTDVVTIFGSFNDSSANLPYGTIDDNGTDTYYGCVNKTIDNLYAILPTVQLGIIAPTPWESVNPTINLNPRYIEMLKNVCEKRGIPFLDLYHESALRPWDSTFKSLAYSKDDGNGVHPDETGHKIIAPRIQKFLEELLLH